MHINFATRDATPWPGRVNVPRVKSRLRYWSVDLQPLHRRRIGDSWETVDWRSKRPCETGWLKFARARNDLRRRQQFRLTKRLTQFSYFRCEISFRDGSRIVPFIAYLGRLRESVITQRGVYCDWPRWLRVPPSVPLFYPSPTTFFFVFSSSRLDLLLLLLFLKRVSVRPRLFFIFRRHSVLNGRGRLWH